MRSAILRLDDPRASVEAGPERSTSPLDPGGSRAVAPAAGRAEPGQLSGGPVRAGWPIHTWPSLNRSAFQIGALAFVSSIA